MSLFQKVSPHLGSITGPSAPRDPAGPYRDRQGIEEQVKSLKAEQERINQVQLRAWLRLRRSPKDSGVWGLGHGSYGSANFILYEGHDQKLVFTYLVNFFFLGGFVGF